MKEENEENPYEQPAADPSGEEEHASSTDKNDSSQPEDDSSDQENGKKHRGKKKDEEREMSFLDHLEELRWRIIYSFIGITVCAVGLWFVIDPIMEHVLLRPATQYNMNLQNLRPFGQVLIYMQVAVFGGVIISMPNIIYQIWKFIAPGLYPHERRYISSIVVFTSLCFLLGVAFAYFLVLPAALKFFVHFGTPIIDNIISIEYYFDFVLTLMIGAGLVFELPMLSFFLSRLGILSPKLMRKYWRHAMVISAIVAAFISPGPDPFSMLLMAIPLVFLYEISIWISKLSQKKGSPRNA